LEAFPSLDAAIMRGRGRGRPRGLTTRPTVPDMFSWKSRPRDWRRLGWKVHMRCVQGYHGGVKSVRRCVYRKQLDLGTLVRTRGPNFPLSRLESRLMCRACASRNAAVVFEPPTNRQVGSG